jgi:mannan endo-1,4-beta-mannosidase
MTRCFNKIVLALLGIASIAGSAGFTISGTELLDDNGKPFVMKGYSIPLAWFVNDVNNNIANMRNRTGANTMRIVVTTSTADNSWQTAVETCIRNKVVPMVELHDVTGNTSPTRLNDMAKFWAGKKAFLTSPNIAKHVLINIANEWGDWAMANSGQTTWRDAYKTAITTLRDAGIQTTLVIDAPGWGQDLRDANALKSYAKELMTHDPRKNLLFSIHMYCEWAKNGTSKISPTLADLKKAGIPLIVGEFGFQHDNGNGGVCDIDEVLIVNTCQANGQGWLAWSWKGNGNGVEYLDLSQDWAGTNLSAWGRTIVDGANGTKTAVTASVFTGSSIQHTAHLGTTTGRGRAIVGGGIILVEDAMGRWLKVDGSVSSHRTP